MYDTRMI